MKGLQILPALASLLILVSCQPKWTEVEKGRFNLVANQGGSMLGYNPESGVSILTVDRYAFKDLNRNGELGGGGSTT